MAIMKSLLLAIGLAGQVLAMPYSLANSTKTQKSTYIPLDSYFNNAGFAMAPGEASFDQLNQSYPASKLPIGGYYNSTKTGITYLFPGYQGKNVSDNVIMAGQTIPVANSSYFSIQMLIAADYASTAVNVTFNYSDGTSQLSEVRSEPYYSFLTIYKGEIVMPTYYTFNDTNYNTSHIFEWVGALDYSKTLTAITFPDTTNLTSGSRMHVFSASLQQGTGIDVQYLRPTQKQSGNGTQIVEVVVNNYGPAWIHGEGVEITIEAPGITTVEPGKIKRLSPGDQKKINVGVVGKANTTANVVFKSSNTTLKYTIPNVTFGLEHFTSDLSSLTKHESPTWFDNAKYGIFIHWGPYAVPGWGNSTPYEVYAEWHWWYSHHRAADTKADVWQYDLDTFGPNVVYDDFFTNFTAEYFDPKEWVDLFADAGAQYFVFTSKHHDGFAMFDTKETTHRNSIHYGPKRNVLQELFDAAAAYQPQLHRGTYFSLPEWYNPYFGPYGFAQSPGNASTSWPGILANNPYTGEVEPYTGMLNISDFIVDLMVPQMEILTAMGSEIMWCDCGAANGSAEFASKWFNQARAEGREVTMNSRCGIPEGSDFDTPEYATFSSVSERKWESNEGMDPYSYGYNRATADDAYMNASSVVSYLVDIVSKNGNFLLDIGPMANGTIHPMEVKNLKEAGTWIKANAEAIFNTTYWFVTAETGDIRFTQAEDAFYVLALTKPSEKFVVDVPVPILEGDVITMIGAGNGTVLDWSMTPAGDLEINVPSAVADAGKWCWTMKITYLA
ncbi:putative alpha-L-fucosidase [Coleophoma crateriformis]|uniref:alpha-L-fucosidase n=1 Tax=Coleophoma crateriformis TaxID=565419 RepID=A0A3D8R463_9HELO|nr:putative alpha-L-fucosidase [Coleophoma crateriformis]